MKRWLARSVIVVVLALACFVGVSWLYAHNLTRARPSVVGSLPEDFGYPIQAVRFASSDGETLSGWLSAAPGSDRSVILLHGFAGNRLQMLPRARFLRALGYTVFLYDARACGESTGDAVTFGYRERHDLIAAVKYLRDTGVRHIACLGVSQGGATILFAAENLTDVKCIICESVYDEMTHAVDGRMRHYTGLPGSLGGCLLVPFAENRLGLKIEDVRPIDYVCKLCCPILVVGGEKDDKTTPEDTRRLFDAARSPRELWLIPEARHEDLFRFAGYEGKVRDYLRRHFE